MHTSIHSEFTGSARHSRTQWFTAYTALSSVTGFLATVAGGSLRRLGTSIGVSGPHGFAVRIGAVRQEHQSGHRIQPRVRDDRDTPLCGVDERLIQVIWVFGKSEYFLK